MKCISLAVLILSVCIACNSSPETLIKSGYDEQEMEAAISKAREKIDLFIAELTNPTGTGHAVKLAIEDENGVEHFWLIEVKYQNGQFAGVINNDPGIVKNVQMGQKKTVKKADISDWMFFRDEKMHGNYTMRPLLKAMPAAEAEQYRAILAEP